MLNSDPCVGDVGTEIGINIINQFGVAVDLSSLAQVVFEVIKPDGVQVTWSGVVVSSTVPNRLIYTTQADDLDISGTYKVIPHISLATWSGHTLAVEIYVHAVGA
jgi:hypothetical protein